MKNQTNTLRDFLAAPISIPIGETSISVQPMGWFDAVAAIDMLAPALASMPPTPENGEGVTGGDVMVWLSWVAQNRAAVLGFCRMASNQEEADIAGLPPALLIELLIGLLEVNADFFVESLPMLLNRAGARTEALAKRIQAVLTRQAQSLMTSNA